MLDIKGLHTTLERSSGEYNLLAQLDFGCALWINRHFIAIACVAFIGGALMGIVNNGSFHHMVSELNGDAMSALTLLSKSESSFKALDEGILFARIAAQNVQASIYTFMLGISFGIGSLIMLIINGAVVGCMLLMLLNSSPSYVAIASVAAHAPVELAGLLMCGAAGLRLGWGLVRAITSSSIWHLHVATIEALSLAFASVAMLLVSSAIETFVSFSPNIAPACKLAVGVVAILMMLICIYMSRLHWMHHRGKQHAARCDGIETSAN